jgi:glycosyltransferase involved in cell wall biosynthesis
VKSSSVNGDSPYVLVVTHLVPYPPARGVELRIWKLLNWLKVEGFCPILVLTGDEASTEAIAELKKVTDAVYWPKRPFRTRLGRKLPLLRKFVWERIKPWLHRSNGHLELFPNGSNSNSLKAQNYKRALCPDSLIPLVGSLARRYRAKAVIAEYVFLTPALQSVPLGTIKIMDTIDVFSRKQEQVLAYGIEDPHACTEEEERAYLLAADVVVAIQSREAELLKALAPEREVLLVGMDFEVDQDLPVNTSKTIAIVASDNELNVHGLKGFLEQCWPRIKTKSTDARLHIVGKVGNRCRIEDPAVRYTTWIDDLSEVYSEARVIVNPTIAGTGLKVKSAQALAHGRPLVAWPNGVEGLNYVGRPPYAICNSWGEIATEVVTLLESPEASRELGERALAYARENFTASQVYAPLKAVLTNSARSNAKAKARAV